MTASTCVDTRLAAHVEVEEEQEEEGKPRGWSQEASVCEMTAAQAERSTASIINGHAGLLALKDLMWIDETNTPRLPGYETIHLDGGANVALFATRGMIGASTAAGWMQQDELKTVAASGKLALEGRATVDMR